MESNKKQLEKPAHPRATANPLSAITFSWTLGLFWDGYKRELEVSDLYSPLKEHTSAHLGDKFEKIWNEEKQKCEGTKRDPSLLRVILRSYGWLIMGYGIILCLLELVVRLSQPLFLSRLILYFTPRSTVTKQEAYLYAGGIILSSAISVFVIHPYMMGIMHIGMKIRVACCSLIYRKALRLSKTALGETTVGQVVNLLSNDVNRFDISVIFVHYLWVGPLETVVITYLMWLEVGPASLIGVVSLLLFIPIQGWLGKKSSSLRMRTASRTDERVRLMNEIISGIQVIKMYTWEKPFAYMVAYARRKEINEISKSSYIRGVLLSFIIFHTRVAIFISIISYVLFGNAIDAQRVFVVTSYYNMLRQTMTVFFPQGIAQVAEALVSVERLQHFMMYEETPLKALSEKESSAAASQKANGPASTAAADGDKAVNGSAPGGVVQQDVVTPLLSGWSVVSGPPVAVAGAGVVLEGASAKWTPDKPEQTLNNISMTVKPGTLAAIIGPVGAGKTSLLHALLGELPLSRGRCSVPGKVSYASQEPWLFAGSVRQNILFGEAMDRERYKRVIKVCALKEDFNQFPQNDKTVVGERGVSLSGGQRARINLARAIYKKADVYLLDDPLSAVDSHVGKHLFEDCITEFLRDKTVILVTHQLQYLSSVDHILLMENGSIVAEGTYQELQATHLDFTKLLSVNLDSSLQDDEAGMKRQSSLQSVASSLDGSHWALDEQPGDSEMRSEGAVSSRVYTAYLSAGGNCCLLTFMLLLCVLSQLLASGSDYSVTYWVNKEERVFKAPDHGWLKGFPTNPNMTFPPDNSTIVTSPVHEDDDDGIVITRTMCIYIFSVLTIATVVVTLVRSFLFFFICMRSSTNLHNTMFESITRATMHFFNTNSSGRILNRFSKDMGAIDEMLPAAMIDCIQIGLTLVGIIAVVTVVNPWLMVPTLIVAVFFFYLRLFYLSTSRSVKRLEGVTRSPVFAHLNASLQGVTTIRAFQAQRILEHEFDQHQDLHSSAWYLFVASSRAFGFWLDVVCLIYIALVTLSFLVLGNESLGGNVGLAITQSIGLTGMFQWGMRQSAELENQMTSVERVLEYSNIEKEAPLESPADKKVAESWPREGRIVFSHLYLRYSHSSPPVLKNLNFTIQPREKVGIVGRTGAGKSSLINALFRLAPIEGSLVIDGIETLALGLHELRSKISIIPQEPVLFSGTMRKNLDPFDEFPDHVLWNVLEEVEMKDVMIAGLNKKVSEGGANLSVGQRQLVCLARAILRNNRILVLDEATANVDPQTDGLIQSTIRRKFASCTVLTIAHRLHTVMDSDKVLVMDMGTMVEFDHPYVLLQNKVGFLSSMVEQTGKTTSELLHSIAAASYKKNSGQPEGRSD